MLRPLSGSCSMRARSTTVATVGLVVVTSGVTSPRTVTSIAPVAILRAGLMTAVCPTDREMVPCQLSIPEDCTVSL